MTKSSPDDKPPTAETYKNPIFLFTSGSLRCAAFGGWYSALGDKESSIQWCHQAYAEWSKELAAGRDYSFAGLYNHDLYKYLPKERLKELVDGFLQALDEELEKAKKNMPPTDSAAAP